MAEDTVGPRYTYIWALSLSLANRANQLTIVNKHTLQVGLAHLLTALAAI